MRAALHAVNNSKVVYRLLQILLQLMEQHSLPDTQQVEALARALDASILAKERHDNVRRVAVAWGRHAETQGQLNVVGTPAPRLCVQPSDRSRSVFFVSFCEDILK